MLYSYSSIYSYINQIRINCEGFCFVQINISVFKNNIIISYILTGILLKVNIGNPKMYIFTLYVCMYSFNIIHEVSTLKLNGLITEMLRSGLHLQTSKSSMWVSFQTVSHDCAKPQGPVERKVSYGLQQRHPVRSSHCSALITHTNGREVPSRVSLIKLS